MLLCGLAILVLAFATLLVSLGAIFAQGPRQLLQESLIPMFPRLIAAMHPPLPGAEYLVPDMVPPSPGQLRGSVSPLSLARQQGTRPRT